MRYVFVSRECELSDKVAKVNLINVHELGSAKTRDAAEVAKHAYFMAANMLVAVRKHVRAKGLGLIVLRV